MWCLAPLRIFNSVIRGNQNFGKTTILLIQFNVTQNLSVDLLLIIKIIIILFKDVIFTDTLFNFMLFLNFDLLM